MEKLNIKGNTTQQKIISLLMTIIGLILILSLNDNFKNLSSNEQAGLFLGFLIFIIGGINLIISNQQEIIIDPNLRQIIIKNWNNFRFNEKIINFDKITDIKIGYLGKKTNFVNFYYLELRLSNEEKYPLFSPGYFYKISTRSKAEEWKLKLENYINNK